MRILLDITHPAHLHFFRAAVAKLRGQGHEVRLTGRDKDVLLDLAARMDMRLETFGGAPRGLVGMASTLVGRQARLAGIARDFRPDVMAGIGGTFVAFVGWCMRIPVLVFSDTESATLSNLITYPFMTRLCTPRSYGRPDRPDQVRYAGYHECAYLLPEVFTPDPTVRDELGVDEGEPYCIVRFVGWGAGHDLGRKGLTQERQLDMVRRLAEHGRVFVSAEGDVPEEIRPLLFRLPVHRMHHALAHARLIVGESSTMSQEAAVLGVPSVFIYPRVELGPTTDLATRHKILHWLEPDDYEAAVRIAVELFRDADTSRWASVGRAIAAESDDVTQVVVDQLLAVADPS